jgi:hypothetical protein
MRSGNAGSPKRVRDWLLNVYPSGFGEVAVWVSARTARESDLRISFSRKAMFQDRLRKGIGGEFIVLL